PAPIAAPKPTPVPAPAPAPSVAQTAPAPEAPEDALAQGGLVDLNTASVADLNRLRGGGAIGKAIVQHRPYTGIEQLLSKRVLSRAVYERIKDQVVVR
ncbi:helix-hairpin-helix domain-containing protein, partial [Methylobacterium sp.]